MTPVRVIERPGLPVLDGRPARREPTAPIVLAVAGDSAAGKTTLAQGIVEILGSDRVTTVCTDDYHRYDRRQRASMNITPLHPDCNYVDIIEQHLALLTAGHPILKPVYNHAAGTFDPPEYIRPREFVVVEGLLPLLTPRMRACFGATVYLDPPEDLRRSWKIRRDCSKRGYTSEQVLAELQRREPESEAFIRPQRRAADMVVRFSPRADGGDEAHLDARLVLRPAQAHPDLTGVTHRDGGPIRLRLGREDGRPVDVLEIDGDATDEEAALLEDALRDRMNGSGGPRNGTLGAFVAGIEPRHSHPLALTQLLIASSLVVAKSIRS